MMRFTTEHDKPVCMAELKSRIGVYLDNWAIIELATRSEFRRERFVCSLKLGGTLLFSLTKAAEIAGPQGASADAVRSFLDSIGAHWVPLELNPYTVARKEQAGLTERAPVSETFMEAYCTERLHDLSQEGKVLDLSEAFFRLSAVVDWAQKNRDKTLDDARVVDDTLRDRLIQTRADYEREPASLDRELPPISFDVSRPATFVLIHLLRMRVLEAKRFQFKDGDGLDLCHSVLTAAYGSLATLDKHWKRRVDNLAKPNRVAKIYNGPELDELVDTCEALVTSLKVREESAG